MENNDFKITDHIDKILNYVYKNRNRDNAVIFHDVTYTSDTLGLSINQLFQCYQYMLSDKLLDNTISKEHDLKFQLSSKAIRYIEKSQNS